MPVTQPEPAAGGSRPDGIPLVIAHRGSSAAAPEHTLGAYRLAIAEGADGLECDVRFSADGELVCLHDRTVERTSDAVGVVATKTLAQLRAMDWGGWKEAGPAVAQDPDNRSLVTLRELIELALGAGREIGLAIETKHPSRFGGKVELEVARLLKEYDLDGARRPGQPWARMMSFSQLAIRRMSELCPRLPTVFLIAAPVPPSFRGGAVPRGAGTAGLDVAILREAPEVVLRQHEQGHEVFVWTVDEEVDVRLCLDLGVDAIISNRPRLVLDLVGGNR